MSDQHDYLRTGNKAFRLTADVTALMLKGAGYAALFCFVVFLVGWLIVGISRSLPEDSKQAPDPTPTSALDPANGHKLA